MDVRSFLRLAEILVLPDQGERRLSLRTTTPIMTHAKRTRRGAIIAAPQPRH